MNITHKFLSEWSETNYYLNGSSYYLNDYSYLDGDGPITSTYRINRKIKYITSLTSVKNEQKEDAEMEREMEQFKLNLRNK